MGMPVVTVTSGGVPVIEVANGLPVSEAANKFGRAVTKVTGKFGLPVTFVSTGGGATAAFASLDGVPTNVTLTNNNLTATKVGNTNNCGARSTALKSTGKFYFEVAPKNVRSNDTISVAATTETYAGIANGLASDVATLYCNGSIWGRGSYSLKDLPGFITTTNHNVCVAVDIGGNLVWFRLDAGPWNNDAAANPATGVGGVAIFWTAGSSLAPVLTFDGNVGASMICNFGASAFVGTVPAGFTAGWSG